VITISAKTPGTDLGFTDNTREYWILRNC